MNIEQLIRIIAGGFMLLSLLLAEAFNNAGLLDGPTWLWFTAFVGANLFQSGFTRWCLMERILGKFGVPSCCAQQPAGKGTVPGA